jgi:hypothetical protein
LNCTLATHFESHLREHFERLTLRDIIFERLHASRNDDPDNTLRDHIERQHFECTWWVVGGQFMGTFIMAKHTLRERDALTLREKFHVFVHM